MKHEINKLCAGCVRSCKREANVTIIQCAMYRKGSKSMAKPKRSQQLNLIFGEEAARHAAR